MKNKLVSVIVTTKNNTATLDECLASITKQEYKPTELIVVDNFSTDDTQDIAKKYTDNVFAKGPERSTQRNFGAKKAKGEYVMIIDSDMVLSPKVISQCVKEMNQPGVTGVVVPEESFGEGFWAHCKKLERSFYVGVPYMEAARFFDKKIFEKVGGFDTDITGPEDWDLSQKVEKEGKLSRTKALIFHNEGRISLKRTIQKKYYYANKFATYEQKNKSDVNINKQASILGRYWLFLRRPGMLFRNPILGLAMLFMKTCEFGFGGAGYIASKLRKTT